jgi:hypothetical protein
MYGMAFEQQVRADGQQMCHLGRLAALLGTCMKWLLSSRCAARSFGNSLGITVTFIAMPLCSVLQYIRSLHVWVLVGVHV